MNKINLMLVDDHPIYRQGLRRIIERNSNLEIIMEAADGQNALKLARHLTPDVAIIDIVLPSLDGLDLTRKIRQFSADMGIVIITGRGDDEKPFHAMRVGANAYYQKNAEPSRLIEAIHVAAQGNYFMNDAVYNKTEINNWLREQSSQIGYMDGQPHDQFELLSRRELEVLREVAKGCQNANIAANLGISHQTVKNHINRIQTKLNIDDRTQAALHAIRRGWIQLGE